MATSDGKGAARAGTRPPLLLMTATIEPAAAMTGNLRADPALRRMDYEGALRFYLGLPEDRPGAVLFAENSGADLGSLRRIAEEENPYGKPVHFFSMVSEAPPERGKGYAELDLLNRAFAAHSGDLASRHVWKLTGRLIVSNMDEMIATAPERFDLYADFRRVPLIGESLGGNDWMDTRLFACTADGYARLIAPHAADAGWTIEKTLFAALYPTLDRDPAIVPRFRRQPAVDGVCAGSNKDYRSLSYRSKEMLRRVSRSVTPGLWL